MEPIVAPFLAIAEEAGICQVVRFCWTTMLHADDMIDFATEVGVIFMNQAIFAQALCASHYLASQVLTNVVTHLAWARCWRARALASLIKCSSWM
jgi:hypothetical protein